MEPSKRDSSSSPRSARFARPRSWMDLFKKKGEEEPSQFPEPPSDPVQLEDIEADTRPSDGEDWKRRRRSSVKLRQIDEWEEMRDNSGGIFYYNASTGACQWERPIQFQSAAERLRDRVDSKKESEGSTSEQRQQSIRSAIDIEADRRRTVDFAPSVKDDLHFDNGHRSPTASELPSPTTIDIGWKRKYEKAKLSEEKATQNALLLKYAFIQQKAAYETALQATHKVLLESQQSIKDLQITIEDERQGHAAEVASLNQKIEEIGRQTRDGLLTIDPKAQSSAEQQARRQFNQLLKSWEQDKREELEALTQKWKEAGADEFQMTQRLQTEALERYDRVIAEHFSQLEQQMKRLRENDTEKWSSYEKQSLIRESDTEKRMMDYEQSVREKYDKMLAQKVEEDRHLRRELEEKYRTELNKLDETEQERASRILQEKIEYEEQVRAKFKAMLEELQETWKTDMQTREGQIEDRFKAHYEAQLSALQEQLQLALKLNDDIDKRWMNEMDQLNKRQLNTMSAFEEKVKTKYQSMILDYEAQAQDQIAQYEAQWLQRNEEALEEKRHNEAKLRKAKIALSRWRMDYQAHIQEKYKSLLSKLEETYVVEIENHTKELADAKEKLAMERLLWQEHEMTGKTLGSFFDLGKMSDEKGSNAMMPSDTLSGKETLSNLKSTLKKLWKALETESGDIISFLQKAVDSSTFSPDVVSLYQTETARLTARVPIMEAVTRREFLKYRLDCINKMIAEPSKLFKMNQTRLLHESEERDGVWKELRSLSEQLTRLLGEYQRSYGNFMYKGKLYLDIMADDLAALKTAEERALSRSSPRRSGTPSSIPKTAAARNRLRHGQ